jgi:hypothetical protein
MKRELLVLFCVFLLFASVASAAEDDGDTCGFFCKIITFIGNIFEGDVSDSGSIGGGGAGEGPPVLIDEPDPEPAVAVDDTPPETYPIPEPVKTIEEIKEEAIEEQIEIVEERAIDSFLSNINVKDPQCEIDPDKDTVIGTEKVKSTITFSDEAFKFETVDVSCDQFERYGKSGDRPYREVVPSSLSFTNRCDWGRVSVPTVYFIIVSDISDKDLCATPITVMPRSGSRDTGADGCFTDTALKSMKNACDDKGFEYFSIPDANGCDTVYCGAEEFSQCAPEALLEKATLECEAQGENYLAYTYSEEFAGQDWPCAQIRCSLCSSQEELDVKREACLAKGDGWDPATETDFETTGCPYIACNPPNSGGEDVVELPPE